MTISDTTFVLLDTETAGVEKGDDLLEIAAWNLRDGSRYETLVRPTRPIPAEASAVHHLVEADFTDAPVRDVAMEKLLGFVSPDAVLTAHAAAFDRGVLAPAFDGQRWLCTERLAHHLVPDAPNFKNATLWYFLGGPKIVTALHRAGTDLRITEFVLLALLERYRVFAVRECAGDDERLARSELLETLLTFAARPYRIERMPFGKHKGRLMADVAREDARYLRWCLTGMDDLSPDLRWNIERVLGIKSEAA